MENIDYSKTKLAKSYFSSHIYEIATNLLLTSAIISLLFAFAPLAVALIFVLYAFIAIMISIFIVLITIGLVFADPNHPLNKMLTSIWKTFELFNINNIVNVQQVAIPITLSLSVVFFLVTLLFTIFDKNRSNKTKPIVFLVISIIFMVVTLIVYIFTKGGQA